jgi:hypothetical protein
MAEKDVTALVKQEAEKRAPAPLQAFASGELRTLNDLFPGEKNVAIRDGLKENGLARYTTREGEASFIAADLDINGNVMAMAAAVPRAPTRSDVYLKDDVPDLSDRNSLNRPESIKLYHQIFENEGIVNNAITKKASLISQDGEFEVRTAKQGKRPRKAVVADVQTLLNFWTDNVNSSHLEGAVTGSRGLKQVVRRGARQAMIEGDLFMRQVWQEVPIPELGNKSFKVPIVLQALPAADVEIAEDLLGFGIELYYWVPDRSTINKVLRSRDPEVKKVVDRVLASDVKSQLQKTGKVLLDPALLIHLKNNAIDTLAYGQSDVAPVLTDLAYARALKSLDFVTIDSLVNRMLVVKIGDENPDSDYHNIAAAQQRVGVFNRLLSEVGPNMLILWAGHDVDTTDIGAHNQILDTDQRHTLASKGVKISTGVPDPLLTGSADGGNAVAWAGFISLAAVATELQEEWAQGLTQLGQRIALENGYTDLEIEFQFSHRLLADRESNAKIMVQAYQLGLLSKRTTLDELGHNFDIEKTRRVIEEENGDMEIFMPPPINVGGPAGDQGPGMTDQPGRPNKTDDPDKVGPDRDREDRDLG